MQVINFQAQVDIELDKNKNLLIRETIPGNSSLTICIPAYFVLRFENELTKLLENYNG